MGSPNVRCAGQVLERIESWRDSRPYCGSDAAEHCVQPTADSGAFSTRWHIGALAWAHRCCARMRIVDCYDDIADHALARAWVALTPARFMAFPTLAKLLAYLRACVTTTAIDCVRADRCRALARGAQRQHSRHTREQLVLVDLDRATLWGVVLGLATTEAERILLVESFANSLPPRAIQVRHP